MIHLEQNNQSNSYDEEIAKINAAKEITVSLIEKGYTNQTNIDEVFKMIYSAIDYATAKPF
jgi:hypothetical protein